MGIRRALAGAVLGVGGSVLLALPAAAVTDADPYGPAATPGALSVSSSTVAPGGTVVVTGSGFGPNTAVSLTVSVVNSGFRRVEAGTAPLGSFVRSGTPRAASVQGFAACVNGCTVTAGASGTFSVAMRLTRLGANVITANGVTAAGGPLILSATVIVTNGAGAGGSGSSDGSGVGGLPDTGSNLKTPVVLGSILVLVGAGATLVGRRRRRTATTT
jgi:LPXTG-motif cell wall-anchored protein